MGLDDAMGVHLIWAVGLKYEIISTPSRRGDSPTGACGFAPLRRQLRCCDFLPEVLRTLRCGRELSH